jgi:hypothetical protein
MAKHYSFRPFIPTTSYKIDNNDHVQYWQRETDCSSPVVNGPYYEGVLNL